MNAINNLLDNSREFKEIISKAEKGLYPISVSGSADAQKAHLADSVARKLSKKVFIITYNDIQAKRICDDLSFFSDSECVYIPPKETVLYEVEASNHEIDNKRAAALSELSKGANAVVSVESLLHFVADKKELTSMNIALSYGGVVDAQSLPEKLVSMGYVRVDVVNLKGQFAIRGGIVDIYPPDALCPVRMELFGDDIDSLRRFDCDSQMSIEKIDNVQIIPVSVENSRETMLSYLGDDYVIFVDEPQRISEAAKAVEWEIAENIRTLAEKSTKKDVCECINSY